MEQNKKKISCWNCNYHEPCKISKYGYCTWFHTTNKEKKLVPAHVADKGCKYFINKVINSPELQYILELFKGELIE